ncbi:E3 ubiquitin-protein ligase parkin [Orchesella cincta]|uniref:E3 ubiquitin-protein ligase parkin n=1 Tax=Orchesella cincta TaxID=48709 RepID=A0A1D2NHJ2_ORCCI|nr:E3 ubiquitin-protein ligase parkin [Orchesella cincta]
MVFGEILRAVAALFEGLLRLLGMASVDSITIGPNSLRVFIKYAGRTISTDLDPRWEIRKVKEMIAPKLGVSPEEIKIIFAGNELPDSFVLETSDVGQQSYLHAVRVRLQLKVPEPNENEVSVANANSMVEQKQQDEQAENLVVQSCTRTFVTTGPEMNLSVTNTSFEKTLEEAQASDNPPVPVNTRSDFFVYCSTCDDLKEGKLRVRCAQCLSGAFTVSRHPQGWDDVLNPKQIEGTCEDEACDCQYAGFYFKCASHVTAGEDDSSPPLQQVKRNEDSVPCLACGDAKDISFVFTCENAHSTCVDCFKQYALTKINQRDYVQDSVIGYTLGCPALCENSLLRDPHHFKLMGKQQYNRYQRFATEECLIQMGGIFCPQPDCGMGIIPEDVNCNKIACLHGCEYVFCRRCLEGWHIGECRQEGTVPDPCTSSGPSSTGYYVSADRAAQAQWGDATRRAMRLSTKPCPNCRVPTERAGGCMHMECTKCKFQWCWVCQTSWNRECMGNHWFG